MKEKFLMEINRIALDLKNLIKYSKYYPENVNDIYCIMFCLYLIIALYVFFFGLTYLLDGKAENPYTKTLCWTIFWPIYFIKLIVPKILYLVVSVLNYFLYDMVGKYFEKEKIK